MIDINEFRRNQSRVPRAELEKYNGQYVAWSPDGSRIVAADPDPLRVDALLCAAGYDPAEILVSRVALDEEASWNGWSFAEGSNAVKGPSRSAGTRGSPDQAMLGARSDRSAMC